MKRFGTTILAWAKRYERHLSTVFFIGGFVGDVITYLLLPITYVNYFFLANLVLAGICTIGSHTLVVQFPQAKRALIKTFHFLFPLGAQFFIGGLLSGFLIFYTKSAVLFVSWPFLLLLLLIFLGNEVFRDFRAHLAFQTVLFYFSIYAYLIFALPLWVHKIGPTVFLWSTLAAVGAFALFMLLIACLGLQRLTHTLGMIIGGSVLVLVLVAGSYYLRLVPPIPLTLQQGGVYHSITWNKNGAYVVQTEGKRWLLPWGQVIHHVPGTPIYAYSSVFAPVAFSLDIVHVWEWYDPATKAWEEQARIEFPVTGGRGGGYRGYSEKSIVAPGKWMISVETPNGQIIGRMRFQVMEVSTEPKLHQEVK